MELFLKNGISFHLWEILSKMKKYETFINKYYSIKTTKRGQKERYDIQTGDTNSICTMFHD